MFDETNKTEEKDIVFPENLFGDDDENTSADTYEENHTEVGEAENEGLIIKYNGEERKISLDEARILAQKGMNYDHVVAERDTKYKRELDFLDKMAAEKGLSRAEYMSAREKDMSSQEEKNKTEANGKEESGAATKESRGIDGEWENLFREYPVLSRSEAEAELGNDVKGGLTPLEAYQKKLIAKQAYELRAMHHNERVANRSVGSMTSDTAALMKDDFLEGFSFDD